MLTIRLPFIFVRRFHRVQLLSPFRLDVTKSTSFLHKKEKQTTKEMCLNLHKSHRNLHKNATRHGPMEFWVNVDVKRLFILKWISWIQPNSLDISNISCYWLERLRLSVVMSEQCLVLVNNIQQNKRRRKFDIYEKIKGVMWVQIKLDSRTLSKNTGFLHLTKTNTEFSANNV